MATYEITRMGAAELQLEEAIKLFFKKGNPFIIHVLSQNAHEVIKCSVKDLGYFPAYEEAIEIVSKNDRDGYVDKIKSLFEFKDKQGKSAEENLKILATVINNKQRNMLKHSELSELNEGIELNDYQNIICIMDAIILLKKYKSVYEPTWNFQDKPWHKTFDLFFREVGQYYMDTKEFPMSSMVDVFIKILHKNCEQIC